MPLQQMLLARPFQILIKFSQNVLEHPVQNFAAIFSDFFFDGILKMSEVTPFIAPNFVPYSPCHLVLSTLLALATVFTSLSFLSSHLLVPPASFKLLHVSYPSIFSLVLSSSFHFRVPASFLFPIHSIA